ncbi:hypothetical protein TrVGV298_006829 [Trichoderma virens]|nr:hypothetical protein TrVGV298_006829 [Trichoderma virens]
MDSGSLPTLSYRSSDGNEDGSKESNKTAVRHTRGAKRILKEWFSSHSEYPYPSEGEKAMLRQQTGLSRRQITYWFTNARRRGVRDQADLPCARSAPAVAIPDAAKELGNMDPLSRWRHTPPDEDGTSLDAIIQAIESGAHANLDPESGLAATAPPTAPASSFGSSGSCPSSHSGARSYSSGSAVSTASRRRRGRRRQKLQLRQSEPEDAASRIYQCTFCTDSFKSKYDWTRHEGTLHLALDKWTCLPFGPRHLDDTAKARCAFCDIEDPSDVHLQSHEPGKCMVKPLDARVFYRKDHLRQHVRTAHGVTEMPRSMDGWRSKIVKVNSRCGFCGSTFTTWPERNDHLADHFQSGALMKDWKGCRGLDPAIALMVENAMPPYLIGIESNNPEPFSATTSRNPYGSRPDYPVAPTHFETLIAQLGDYVRRVLQTNVVLSDDVLRRQARLIMFGDDDPWNQTPADNSEWLGMFKKGYGLVASPGNLPTEPGADPGMACQSPELALLPGVDWSGPFTMANMQQAAALDFGLVPFQPYKEPALPDQSVSEALCPGPAVPWAWQTPECLAEFRQMCQSQTQVLAQDEGPHAADANLCSLTCLLDSAGLCLQNDKLESMVLERREVSDRIPICAEAQNGFNSLGQADVYSGEHIMPFPTSWEWGPRDLMG